MNSHPPSFYTGFNLETGDRVLFYLKVGIVALIFLPFGVGATALLASAACAAMGYEWFRLTTHEHDFDEPILGIALSAAALPPFVTFAIGPAGGIIIALLAAGFLLQMGPKDDDRLLKTAPGLFLIGLAGVCFVWIRDDVQHGLALTAWLISVVFATELGSGFISRYMAEQAKSTDTGTAFATELIVSLACGAIAGLIVAAFYREGSVLFVMVASMLLAASVLCAAAVTDYFKQRTESRPSGSLFFGRGAVLENLDGLIFASISAGFMMLVGGALFNW